MLGSVIKHINILYFQTMMHINASQNGLVNPEMVDWTSLTMKNCTMHTTNGGRHVSSPSPLPQPSELVQDDYHDIVFSLPTPPRPSLLKQQMASTPGSENRRYNNSTTSTSSSSNQHIYMEVDPRYEVDSGFTEESSEIMKFPLMNPTNHNHHIESSENEEDPSANQQHRRKIQKKRGKISTNSGTATRPRNKDAYLLSWQHNNKNKNQESAPEFKKVPATAEAAVIDDEVFTISKHQI